MTNGNEQDVHNSRVGWERVGGYLSDAMQEVAGDLGGEEFADQIVAAAKADDVLPNPIALKILEDSFPGSAELVMARSAEIQQQAFESELASIQKTSVRKYGRAMLYSIYKKSLHPLTHYHRP